MLLVILKNMMRSHVDRITVPHVPRCYRCYLNRITFPPRYLRIELLDPISILKRPGICEEQIEHVFRFYRYDTHVSDFRCYDHSAIKTDLLNALRLARETDSITPLLSRLESGYSEICQIAIVDILGRIGAFEAIPVLISTLLDTTWHALQMHTFEALEGIDPQWPLTEAFEKQLPEALNIAMGRGGGPYYDPGLRRKHVVDALTRRADCIFVEPRECAKWCFGALVRILKSKISSWRNALISKLNLLRGKKHKS